MEKGETEEKAFLERQVLENFMGIVLSREVVFC